MVSLLFILINSEKDQYGSGRLLLRPPSCVCVCACVLVCSALVCSTCVWHYCDKAAQPLRGDGECQRLERRSEQLPNIWWNEKHTRWMAGPLTPQRGSRAEGGGQVKPQLCVWNITLSLFCSFSSLHVHTSPQIQIVAHPKHLPFFSLMISHNTGLHLLGRSGVFSPDLHVCRAGELLLSRDIYGWAFLEIICWIDSSFYKITSTYTALTNCILNYAFQKGGTFSVHRNAPSWMQLQTNVASLMDPHVPYV